MKHYVALRLDAFRQNGRDFNSRHGIRGATAFAGVGFEHDDCAATFQVVNAAGKRGLGQMLACAPHERDIGGQP